ncbi:MAG TPA: prepilin-type N-terminal cleavage/methylation domain-containing protein [Candidatus Paceibacterota bacterium]|nr:prepilin-type N-terminal cleavage/methylation domain-containing protein [Candidatus Paceibacterota bacterium]
MSILQAKSKFNSEHGFTLVEAIVALVVLTVALIPVLQLSDSSLRAATAIRDDMIAAGLAQEGIEVVRTIRDANWFNNQAFNTGLANGTYRVEWNSTSLTAVGSNPPLKLNNGIYNYTTGADTQFYRTITITGISSSELKVTSQVSWTARGNNSKSVQAEEHLFDWK